MPKNPERSKVTIDDVVEMYCDLSDIATPPGPERAKPVDIILKGMTQ